VGYQEMSGILIYESLKGSYRVFLIVEALVGKFRDYVIEKI
jgi:hypothetical protein